MIVYKLRNSIWNDSLYNSQRRFVIDLELEVNGSGVYCGSGSPNGKGLEQWDCFVLGYSFIDVYDKLFRKCSKGLLPKNVLDRLSEPFFEIDCLRILSEYSGYILIGKNL